MLSLPLSPRPIPTPIAASPGARLTAIALEGSSPLLLWFETPFETLLTLLFCISLFRVLAGFIRITTSVCPAFVRRSVYLGGGLL